MTDRGCTGRPDDLSSLLARKMQELVKEKDLISDLHTHSNWSDGQSSLRMMAETACRRGLKILAITDHSISAPGLSSSQLAQQRKEIDRLREEFQGRLTLLHGAEVNILPDGRMDFADDILESLDIVVGSLHTHLTQPRRVITERLLKAIDNPHVDIIAHPTGRYIPDGLPGADLEWERVFWAANQRQVALEINASPNHLDMDDYHAMLASEAGCLISIDTDAHSKENLSRAVNGVVIARNALIAPAQIVNTWPEDQLLSWLNRHN